MRTIFRTACTLLAIVLPTVSTVPAAAAYTYSPFSRYFQDSPDFVVEQAFQYDNAYTFFVRVCNRGDTPVRGGNLRVAVGRSANDREERNYSGLTPAAGSCSNFELTNVRSYGRKENRTYSLLASVAWNGDGSESSVTNNSKVIPASASTRDSTPAVASSWTSSNSRKVDIDPVNDLYLDSGHNPYAGRTWYYSNGGAYSCGGYWDGNVWRPYSRYVSDYESDYRTTSDYLNSWNYRQYPYSYSSSAHCYEKYVPGTSGYYWNGTSGSSYSSDGYYSDGNTYYYNNGSQYTTTDRYYSTNFYVNRLGRDGGARNVLATVCNDGADMGEFKDLSVTFRNLSRNTSFRATQYVKLLSGQCRDISVNFSSFAVDFTGYQTFEVTVDSDNRFLERNENDNTLKANVWVDK